MLERTNDMLPCWYIWSLRPRGNGVCSRLVQLGSAESLRFFISFLDSPGCLVRFSTGATLINIFNRMIIFNEVVI